jgi:hemoglobin
LADAVPTLFEWIGGAPALEGLTDRFYVRVKADPLLAPVFAHMDDRHPHFVAQFLGEVFGGPAAYSAERGGHAHMLSRHFARHLNRNAAAGLRCLSTRRMNSAFPPTPNSARR